MEIRNTQQLLSTIRNEDTVARCIEESQAMLRRIHSNDGNEDDLEEGDKIDEQPQTDFFSEREVASLHRITFKILDNIIVQMDKTFEDFPKLKFYQLLDHTRFNIYNTDFLEEALSSLIECYPFFWRY